MKKSELRALIREQVKSILKEATIDTIDTSVLKPIILALKNDANWTTNVRELDRELLNIAKELGITVDVLEDRKLLWPLTKTASDKTVSVDKSIEFLKQWFKDNYIGKTAPASSSSVSNKPIVIKNIADIDFKNSIKFFTKMKRSDFEDDDAQEDLIAEIAEIAKQLGIKEDVTNDDIIAGFLDDVQDYSMTPAKMVKLLIRFLTDLK